MFSSSFNPSILKTATSHKVGRNKTHTQKKEMKEKKKEKTKSIHRMFQTKEEKKLCITKKLDSLAKIIIITIKREREKSAKHSKKKNCY